MFYTFKLLKHNQAIDVARTPNKRRFALKLGTLNSQNWARKGYVVHLKVRYGRHTDCFGKRVTFSNEGYYSKPDELYQDWRAFIEK